MGTLYLKKSTDQGENWDVVNEANAKIVWRCFLIHYHVLNSAKPVGAHILLQ